MTFYSADILTLVLFVIFSLIMAGIVIYAVKRTGYKFKKFLICFGLYILAFWILTASGLVLKYMVPVAPLMLISVIAVSTAFALSEYGRRIAAQFSFAALIGFQSFRLPLELILHHWAELKTVPPTMTWTGQNWDIITGIVSLAAIPFANKSLKVAWAAQVIGCGLLVNVIRVVIMSSPFPFAWTLENPLQLVAHMPYVLIAPLFVGTALAAHIIAFRRAKNSQGRT